MDEAGELQSRRDQIPSSAGPIEESGFLENFAAGVGGAIDEETMIGSYLHQGAYRDRDREIDKAILAENIPVDGYTDGDEIDYPRLAYDLKRAGYDIRDDYDVRQELRAELGSRRKYRESVASRASGWGNIGMFAGYAAGASLDPVNVGMMFVPGLGWARAGSTMAKAGKAALWYGGTAAVGEAAIQYAPTIGVSDWKRQLGVEYNNGDALTAIALTAGGTGIVGAGIDLAINSKAVNTGFNNLKERIKRVAPESEQSTLLKETELAQQDYNWHTALYRRDQVMRRVERLKALREQLNDTAKQRKLDAQIDQLETTEFHEFMDTIDAQPLESVEDVYTMLDEWMPDEKYGPDGPDDPKFDTETNAVIRQMDDLDRIEAEDMIDPDDVDPYVDDEATAGFETGEKIGDPFTDFDEFEYQKLTSEQKDEYLREVLGEEDLDSITYAEEIGIDADGNVMTRTRTRGESEMEAKEMNDQLDEFVDCWRGNT